MQPKTLNTYEHESPETDDAKQKFAVWLIKNRHIKYSAQEINDCFESVMSYAQSRNITKTDFWLITDFREFNKISNTVLSNKIYKFTHPHYYKVFDGMRKLYSDFLKETYSIETHTPADNNGLKEHTEKDVSKAVEDAISVSVAKEETKEDKVLTEVPNKEEAIVMPQDELNFDMAIPVRKCEFPAVDFDKKEDYSYSRVITVSYKNKEQNDIHNWQETYLFILRKLYEEYRKKLRLLLQTHECEGIKISCSHLPTELRLALKIDDDFYAEGNLSTLSIVRKIGALLRYCDIPFSDVVICYSKGNNGGFRKKKKTESSKHVQISIDSYHSAELSEYIKWLLNEKHFVTSTARGYAHCLEVIDAYAMKHRFIKESLFRMEKADLITSVKCILIDKNFSEYNIRKHHRFSATLQAYIEYQTGKRIDAYDRNEHQYAIKTDQNKDTDIKGSRKPDESQSVDKSIGYIYHKVFGFGKILSRGESVLIVLFDNYSKAKKLQKGHPSFKEITADDYFNKKQIKSKSSYRKPVPVRIPWDKYEVALLIEAFWKVENKQASRDYVVAKLSQDLRNKAINHGIAIDGTFRNINGINMQLSCIGNSFFPERPVMHKAAILDEMADVFKNDRPQFNNILGEAYLLVQNLIGKEKRCVDFKNIGDMSYTRPIGFTYRYREQTGFNSWVDCYHYVMKSLYADYPSEFFNMADNPHCVFLSHNGSGFARPLVIAEHIYTEANRGATRLVESIKYVVDKCGLPYENINIEYEEKKDYSGTSFNANSDIRYDENINNRQGVLELHEKCPAELKMLLAKKFPYGIRVDSDIDLARLRNFAEALDVIITSDKESLKAQIRAGGISYAGKIYVIPNEVFEEIRKKTLSIFAEGSPIIYYENLYDKFFDWFNERHVFSAEFVREIISNRMSHVYIGKNFLSKGSDRISEIDAMEIELTRVWNNSVTHTYDELYELLPYVPQGKIRFYLSRSKKFVWTSPEKFAIVEKFIITEDEKNDIITYANDKCDSNGYVSISDIPLGNLREENYELSINAIYDMVYNLVLKDRFSLKGKILNKNNSNINTMQLVEKYCSNKDECSLTELNKYVQSIDGVSRRQTALKVAYERMVRVEKDCFVSDNLVDFNIDAIDALLDECIAGDFISIKGIATFALFPDCNYQWNHFLLESFCLRFSRKFRLDVMNFNDKNAGMIVRKNVTMGYLDMLAVVAANAKIELTEEIVGRYLFITGYVAKSKFIGLSRIVKNAREKREVL